MEIVTEAAQFPEKDYINGIFVAVHEDLLLTLAVDSLYEYEPKGSLFSGVEGRSRAASAHSQGLRCFHR